MKDIASINGFFAHKDFYDILLRHLKPGGSVVEVGVFFGKSIAYLANESKNIGLNIYGVDSFRFNAIPFPENGVTDDDSFYERCVQNLFECEIERMVTLLRMESVKASCLFQDRSLDCVFIDGDHSEESVTNDIKAWMPKIKRGGIISGDDYIHPWIGVMNSVDRLVPDKKIIGQAWWSYID